MAFKAAQFRDVPVGTRFENCGTEYVKVSERKAARGDGSTIQVTAGQPVNIIVPDPTPEELAAKAAERDEQRLRYVRRHLDGMVSGVDETLAKFVERAGADVLDAFVWQAERTVRAAADRFVGLRMLQTLDFDPTGTGTREDGMDMSVAARIERVRESAILETIRGARDAFAPDSPFSNLVEQAKVAAFAKVASKLTELRRW